MLIDKGKINIILDGQFGSCGKGLLASYVAVNNLVDISVSNCSANAGHTFYHGGIKYVVRHIPVSGIINEGSIIYFSPAAVINVDVLFSEMNKYNINPARVFIHPNTCIIQDKDIFNEQKENCFINIASTRSGVGSALSRKIKRESNVAFNDPRLKSFIGEIDLQEMCLTGKTVLVETSQGIDLSINSGLRYPYCTSREITVSSTLSDVQCHPKFLGKVCVVIRTTPIRVGNIVENGEIVGYSGPFYSDSFESSWSELGLDAEYTTVTKRKRRVASFSFKQYNRMVKLLQPDYILLNFANYLNTKELDYILANTDVTHISFGPSYEYIIYV